MFAYDNEYYDYDSEIEKVDSAFEAQEKFENSREWVEALVDEIYGDDSLSKIEDILEELAGYYDVSIPRDKEISLMQQ